MNRLLLLDPGLVNLKSAVRGTLATVLSFFAVSFLAQQFHEAGTLAFVAVLIAMMGSLTINDPSQREQRRTLLILPFLSATAFALSVMTEFYPVLRIGGFLAVTFFSVAARRYGPRGVALGMVSFMAYFCPLFFPVHASSIPIGIVAVFVAAAVTFVIRFLVVPDRPQQDLKLYMKSFGYAVEDILITVARELDVLAKVPVANRQTAILKGRSQVQKHLNRVIELGLILETFLASSDSKVIGSSAEALRMEFFEREFSLRRFLDVVSQWVTVEEVPVTDLKLAADQIRYCLHESGANVNLGASSESSRAASIQRFQKSLQDLVESERNTLRIAENFFERCEQVSEPRATVRAATLPGLHISTRQAIQATVATGLASAIGVSISSQRWYWASLTAFVVFAGATRGETLQRAFLRVLGTIGGLIVGFLLAYGLSGHHSLEWTVVILAVFVAIYGAKVAFGFWSASMFTLMLAVLYDILGQLTEQILILRLEETMVGAVIGSVVAAVFIPTSTRATVKEVLAQFLNSVADTLEELPKKAASPFARRDLVKRLREVDRNLVSLRSAAAPIIGRISILRKGDLPGTVYEAAVLSHFLRHLATYTGPLPVLTEQDIYARCTRLALKARILSNHLATKNSEPVTRLSAIDWPDAAGDLPSHWFSRMDQILGSLRQASLFQGKS